MRLSRILPAALAAIAMLAAGACGREEPKGTERWVTTENTQVSIDWDKINEAYKKAEGPEDFEKRVNEIYEGDEIISVAVQDQDAQSQVVTGFFDKNTNGAIDEGEKVFTIQRNITEGAGQYQIQGHGMYASYHSPMMSIATGMLLGSMLSSAFRPNYVPVYTQPYVTSQARRGELTSHRSQYRAQNPSRFKPKASATGRTYGSKGGSWGSTGSRSRSGRSGGGGRFGARSDRRRGAKPQRLTA